MKVFFFEDIALWMDGEDIRYTQNVSFTERNGYNHLFDFVIPTSRRQPEHILKIINNPNKDYAQAAAFAWVDTKEVRPADALAFTMLNDRDRIMTDAVNDVLKSYDITPIPWSKREENREMLAA